MEKNVSQIKNLLFCAALLTGFAGLANGQAQAADTAIKPDPSHIPFVLPKDIKWKVDTAFGEDEAPLFGDVSKPGLYGMLIRWKPGQFSTPHFHSTDRYIYVVSGTWWVSSSDHYDPKTTYPLPAGSFATDMKEKIHWDGAKDETVILELVGEGPATTEKVVGK